jgi:hypothetical protein
MKFKTVPTTKLAKMLSNRLLAYVSEPGDVECVETDETIEGSTDYNTVVALNPNATGAHYLAYGYYYLLCYDKEQEEDYVAIHEQRTGRLIGTITTSTEIQVLIRGADITN